MIARLLVTHAGACAADMRLHPGEAWCGGAAGPKRLKRSERGGLEYVEGALVAIRLDRQQVRRRLIGASRFECVVVRCIRAAGGVIRDNSRTPNRKPRSQARGW